METETQHIRIKTILEVLGKPKEFIKERIKDYLKKIKEDENLMIISENISEAKEEEGEVFSIFAEMEMVIKGMSNLVGFCLDYMPSSIEVLKPEKFDFEQRDFTNFVNDMLAKLHRTDMIAKKHGTENNILKKNMNSLIINNLLVLIRLGINKQDTIAKATGIDENEVKVFLDKLKDRNMIKFEEDIYKIV